LSADVLVEAFATGLACACASCLTDLPAEFDPAQTARLRGAIRVQRVGTS
jgi:hypothetical protein